MGRRLNSGEVPGSEQVENFKNKVIQYSLFAINLCLFGMFSVETDGEMRPQTQEFFK